MDRYNHWLGKLLAFINRLPQYAITLRQTTYYSVAQAQVSIQWRKHEDHHKVQWREEGTIKFLIKYLWYSLRYGYKNNPYEVEAVSASEVT
jgi:hypothetical protein